MGEIKKELEMKSNEGKKGRGGGSAMQKETRIFYILI